MARDRPPHGMHNRVLIDGWGHRGINRFQTPIRQASQSANYR